MSARIIVGLHTQRIYTTYDECEEQEKKRIFFSDGISIIPLSLSFLSQ